MIFLGSFSWTQTRTYSNPDGTELRAELYAPALQASQTVKSSGAWVGAPMRLMGKRSVGECGIWKALMWGGMISKLGRAPGLS